MSDFLHFLQKDMAHVVPLAVLGAIGVAIIIERTWALFILYPMNNPESFFRKVREYVIKDQINEALAVCDQYGSKLAPQIVKEGLMRGHQPEALIENGLEIAVADGATKVGKRTPFLSMVANVSTLIGLFLTILGLIESFNSVKDPTLSPALKSARLNAGIGTAMFGTMSGLGIAIPCMIAYSFLQNRANKLTAELDHAAMKTLDFLKQRFYSTDSKASYRSGKRAA